MLFGRAKNSVAVDRDYPRAGNYKTHQLAVMCIKLWIFRSGKLDARCTKIVKSQDRYKVNKFYHREITSSSQRDFSSTIRIYRSPREQNLHASLRCTQCNRKTMRVLNFNIDATLLRV